MMTLGKLTSIMDDVRFVEHPVLQVRVRPDGPEVFYLQVVDPTLPSSFNTGRKWRISSHMTKSEVVLTAFKAYMTWLEHEARESFEYRGRKILDPHFDVDALWEMAGQRESREYRS